MNRTQLLGRLRAHAAGRALPIGDTIRFPIADSEHRMLLAFVRMGGESSPWGVAYETPETGFRALTVPEPRNRDLVAEMMAEFAPTLLKHLSHPGFRTDGFGPETTPLRQLWTPNPTHVEMLHLLAYRYVYAKKSDDQERLALLNALGRACGWVFRESQRAGQGLVISATEALRSSYAFPTDEIRQGHLGFLLAWLEGEGSELKARWDLARQQEEQPIATSLDPALERGELQPALERFHEARNVKDVSTAQASSQHIHDILENQLRLRLELVNKALAVLQADPRPINSGCQSLAAVTLEEQFDQFVKIESALAQGERAFVPDPDTDRWPAAAASRYNRYVAASDEHVNALVHHDHAMQMEQVEAGNGIYGELVGVEDHGSGRKRRPIWTVRDDGKTSLRLREGSDVCVAAISGRVGRIRTIAPQPDGTRLFTIEITKGKTNRLKGFVDLLPADSEQLIGETVVLLATSHSSLGYQRAQKVWRKDGPGAWLTHAKGY